MEYLNSMVLLLQDENAELKQKLKRIMDLNEVLSQMRQTNNEQSLNNLHADEIKTLREMHQDAEATLKNEIKKLRTEIIELSQSLQADSITIISSARELQDLKNLNQHLQSLINQNAAKFKADIQAKELECQTKIKSIEQKYVSRQKQIMNKFLQKLEEEKENFEEQTNQEIIKGQTLKIQLQGALKEKDALENHLKNLRNYFNEQDFKKKSKIQNQTKEIYCMENEILTLKRKNTDTQNLIIQLNSTVFSQSCLIEQLNKQIQYRNNELQFIQKEYKRQLLKERSKSFKAMQSLSVQKNIIEHNLSKSRKKSKDYSKNQQKLTLQLNNIEMTSKHKISNCNKSTAKSSRKSVDTLQSMSLDNSLLAGDSPQISSFKLNNCDNNISNTAKHPKNTLKIQPKCQWSKQQLRMNDLDTPCFESWVNDEKRVKRTIKIRK